MAQWLLGATVTDRLLRRVLFLGLLLLALIMASLSQSGSPLRLLSGELSARTAPLFGLSYRLGQNLRGSVAAWLDRRDVRAENQTLLQQVQTLESQNSQLRAEVRRLAAALRVKESQATRVVAVAPVVGEDASGLYRRLFLGLGERSGLRVGMPVSSPAGLVGLIVEVAPESATVRTILDPESRVGVSLENKSGRGIASGQPPGRLLMEFSPQADLKVGDKVLSGALQGLFPEGVVVGTVESVSPRSPGALRQSAVVKPSVEFSLLEEVVVLPSL